MVPVAKYCTLHSASLASGGLNRNEQQAGQYPNHTENDDQLHETHSSCPRSNCSCPPPHDFAPVRKDVLDQLRAIQT